MLYTHVQELSKLPANGETAVITNTNYKLA